MDTELVITLRRRNVSLLCMSDAYVTLSYYDRTIGSVQHNQQRLKMLLNMIAALLPWSFKQHSPIPSQNPHWPKKSDQTKWLAHTQCHIWFRTEIRNKQRGQRWAGSLANTSSELLHCHVRKILSPKFIDWETTYCDLMPEDILCKPAESYVLKMWRLPTRCGICNNSFANLS